MLKFVAKMKKKMKEEKGLTLIELLAVIVILGIIAAIAIPSISNLIENSRANAVKADAQNAISQANMYFVENASADGVTVTIDTLVSEGYLDNPGSLTDGTVTHATGGHTFTGEGDNSGVVVTFTDATSRMITDSGKSLSVGGGSGGS